MQRMLTVCDPEYCIIVILIAVLVLIRLKAEMLVELFLICDLTLKSFPSESNREFLGFESNRECSDQIFAWSHQILRVVKLRFKSITI